MPLVCGSKVSRNVDMVDMHRLVDPNRDPVILGVRAAIARYPNLLGNSSFFSWKVEVHLRVQGRWAPV